MGGVDANSPNEWGNMSLLADSTAPRAKLHRCFLRVIISDRRGGGDCVTNVANGGPTVVAGGAFPYFSGGFLVLMGGTPSHGSPSVVVPTRSRGGAQFLTSVSRGSIRRARVPD